MEQVSHRYSQEELQKLECFESIDYLPACSSVYGDWLRTQPIGRCAAKHGWCMYPIPSVGSLVTLTDDH